MILCVEFFSVMKPPSATKTFVYDWHSSLQRVQKEFGERVGGGLFVLLCGSVLCVGSLHGRYMTLFAEAQTAVNAECIDEMERCRVRCGLFMWWFGFTHTHTCTHMHTHTHTHTHTCTHEQETNTHAHTQTNKHTHSHDTHTHTHTHTHARTSFYYFPSGCIAGV